MGKTKYELDELFLNGETPTIEEIKGLTNGRVLAGILPLANKYIRYIINLPFILPWKGKFFDPITKDMGKGKNRIEYGLLKIKLFNFETNIIDPLVGDNKVFSLNYDLSGNPWFIRQIRDDMKKISKKLYLGTANFKWRGEHKFVLYFALELAS
ncbi:MAG: hypothetical protein HQK76_03960 [Desulfobacterales bacterium]|nr:hypothetical protein [Desulfobacterales bacterium]